MTLPPSSTAGSDVPSPVRDRWGFVLALFLASGLAALVYEVVWTRLITQLVGHSSYAVTAVLSAYMGGLALGSWALRGAADRARNPLALYGWLEIGAGLSALAVPTIIDALAGAYVSLYREAEGATVTLTVVRFGFALTALAVPTVLLGGTFPVLAAGLRAGRPDTGRRLGWLYGVNTLGAMAGCALAGFWLIEAVGARAAGMCAAGVSLLVGVASLLLARGAGAAEAPASPEVAEAAGARAAGSDPGTMSAAPAAEPVGTGETAIPFPLLAAAAAVSGLAGLAFEVLWTRILALLVASITYSFTALLTVFLAGLALGGAAGGLLADRARNRPRLLGLLLAAGGACACLSLALLRSQDPAFTGNVPAAYGGEEWARYLGWLFTLSLKYLGPMALCLGAAFPVALRCAADARGGGLGDATGRIYAANTLGAIVGPPLATYAILPLLGTLAGAVVAVAALPILLGIWLAVRSSLRPRLVPAAACGCAALALAAFGTYAAGGPTETLFGHRFRGGQKILHREEGPTVSIAVAESPAGPQEPARRWLYTDSFLVAGVSPDYAYMRMLGHLPALLAPERRTALVVGFGTGTTAGALSLHPFRRIDIAEISPEILRAAPWFESVNRGVAAGKVIAPEIRIVLEDGRNHLLAAAGDYDVITAEPPLPYLAGASALYSRDFYAACRARLSPTGVVCQWMPLHGTRPGHYRQMLASFLDVFPGATLWYYRSSALAIGTLQPLRLDYAALSRRLESSPSVLAHLAEEGMGSVPALLGGFLLDPEGFRAAVGDAPVVTDDRPALEFFGAGEGVSKAFSATMHRLLELRGDPIPLLAPGGEEATRAYIVQRVGRAAKGSGHAIRGYAIEYEGRYLEAAEEYRLAVESNPEDRVARALQQENLARLNRMGIAPPVKPGGPAKDPKRPQVKIESLLADLGHEDGQRRMEAVYSLGERGDRAYLPRVVERLGDPVRAVRLSAVWAVGKLGGSEQIPALEKIAAEGDPEISVMALSSLVELGEERHLVTLQKMVKDIEPRVRATAMAALLNLRSRVREWGWLDDRLKDPDREVRKLAVKICGERADAAHVPALREALKTTDWMMRAWVAEALGEIAKPDCVPVLLTCLEDSDRFVRKKAGEAIARAANVGLAFDPEADEATRARQVEAWKRWWERRE